MVHVLTTSLRATNVLYSSSVLDSTALLKAVQGAFFSALTIIVLVCVASDAFSRKRVCLRTCTVISRTCFGKTSRRVGTLRVKHRRVASPVAVSKTRHVFFGNEVFVGDTMPV